MQQDKIFHAIPTQRKKLSETKWWSHRTFKLLISYSAVIFVLQIKCGFVFQLGNTTITFVSLTLLAIEHLKAGQCGVTLILSSTHTCRLLNYNLKEYLSNEEGHFSLFASSLIIWRSWMMMGFGSVIWRAHHRAVQSFLVVAARSFRATTTNKVSVKKNTLGHATCIQHCLPLHGLPRSFVKLGLCHWCLVMFTASSLHLACVTQMAISFFFRAVWMFAGRGTPHRHSIFSRRLATCNTSQKDQLKNI